MYETPPFHHHSHHPKRTSAVCICGGMRTFHLTAASIFQYFVAPLYDRREKPIVFITTWIDSDTHKSSLSSLLLKKLNGTYEIGGVFIDVQKGIEERALKRALNLPGLHTLHKSAIFGLFYLVEMCTELVLEYEKKYEMEFDYIYRLRPDLLFHSPPYIPNVFLKSHYYYPKEASFGGLNDR
jgi:hypothetical protein